MSENQVVVDTVSISSEAPATIKRNEVMGGFAKGLKVIEAFVDNPDDRLSVADVARLSGLDRASARRCILTLVQAGYVQSDGRRYSMSPRILRLSNGYLAASLPRMLQPTLESISQKIHESCSAAVLDDTEIIYIARASHERIMSIGLTVGSRLPAYCTSMGRVLLASLPESEARKRLAASELKAYTQNTITDTEQLLAEFDKIRQQGYALIDQELEFGLKSLAVPIKKRSGAVVAAINVGAQAAKLSNDEMLATILPALLEAQASLSRVIV